MKVISISAIWCPACLIMRPRIDKVLKNFPNIEQVVYDYDIDEEIIEAYQVGTTLPVFILLDEEKEITRIIGEKSEDEILTILRECIK